MNKKSQQQVTLQTLLTTLNLDERRVKNVYLIGSRLWNTQHAQSDYDFLVILADNDEKQPKNKNNNNNKQDKNKSIKQNETLLPKQTTKGIYDVHFYSDKEWVSEIKEEFSFLQLICSFLPESNIFMEKTNYKNQVMQTLLSNTTQVIQKVHKIVERDRGVAEKDYFKFQIARSKKRILHTIRTILLTIDMILIARSETKSELNFSCCEEYNYDLLFNANTSIDDIGSDTDHLQQSWNEFKNTYFPIIDGYLESLDRLIVNNNNNNNK